MKSSNGFLDSLQQIPALPILHDALRDIRCDHVLHVPHGTGESSLLERTPGIGELIRVF